VPELIAVMSAQWLPLLLATMILLTTVAVTVAVVEIRRATVTLLSLAAALAVSDALRNGSSPDRPARRS
jgi:hypothetical protein